MGWRIRRRRGLEQKHQRSKDEYKKRMNTATVNESKKKGQKNIVEGE